MVREHHAPWSRHQRTEAFEEGERVEDDVGGAVAIALLQPVAHTTVIEEGQALLDDRRARGVTTELLEALATALGNAHGGVQGEAVEVGAQSSTAERLLPRAAAGAQVVRAAAFAESGATLDGGGAEVDEQGWIVVRCFVSGRAIGRQLAARPGRAQDAPADRADQALDVVVGDLAVRIEAGAAAAERARERTIEPEAVEVEVEPQAGVEALGEDDGAGVGRGCSSLRARRR